MLNHSKSKRYDQSDNKKISAERIAEDLRFRRLVENSHDGIALFDGNLQVIYRSKSSEKITGWRAEDRLKATFEDLIYPDDIKRVQSDLGVVLQSPGIPITSIYRLRHHKGHYIWLESIFTNMLTEPDINAIVCNFRDISEKKEAEELLISRAEQIENILESIGDAFFAVDKSWVVTYWNHMAEKVLGMSRGDILNRNLWEVYSDFIGSESYKKYYLALETNKVVRFEDYYPPNDTWFDISAFPSTNGLSVYFRDITERLSYIKAIEEQNENLKEISWLQSHVIRAPLARIMGLIQVIKDPKQDAAARQHALSYLLLSADELDEVIRTITDKTDIPRKRPTQGE